MISLPAYTGARDEEKSSIVIKRLAWKNDLKIPTTLVTLAPDKLIIEENIDVLVGVFHIMWEDMPRRRTYRVRLEDVVSSTGDYIGAGLRCESSEDLFQELDRFRATKSIN